MQVLMYRVGEPPKVINVDNELKAMQELVDGYIEVVYLSDGYCLVADEEGVLKRKPINRVVMVDGRYLQPIAGDFLSVKPKAMNSEGLPKRRLCRRPDSHLNHMVYRKEARVWQWYVLQAVQNAQDACTAGNMTTTMKKTRKKRTPDCNPNGTHETNHLQIKSGNLICQLERN